MRWSQPLRCIVPTGFSRWLFSGYSYFGVRNMSELQTALLAIGFGVIVAVYFFGWWQQRKYRQKFGSAFKVNHADNALYQERADKVVLPENALLHPEHEMGSSLTEEAVSDGQISHAELASLQSIDATGDHFIEALQDSDDLRSPPPFPHSETEEQSQSVGHTAGMVQDEACAQMDARSDFIIELHLAEPAPAAVLDGLWQRKFDFGKPVQVCGFALNTQQWERAVAEGHMLYQRFRVALQLVDRGGAISVAKLSDFSDLLLGIANRIKADVAAPDIRDAHHRAVELDAFCARVDQMAGVNLIPPGERLLIGRNIAQAAALHGMTLEADGAFHLLDAQGRSLFALMNQNSKPFQHHTLETFTTAGLTLLLDAPRTEQPAARFDQMIQVAHELARELQLNLVDDNRVLLTDKGLELIRAQIADVEAEMHDYGIVPGGAQARRLFA